MSRIIVGPLLVLACLSPVAAQAADPQRQAEVAHRGADVMPVRLEATTHVFTKTAEGGTQRVVAKRAADAQQVKLVRAHLRDIQAEFLKGDFSGPSHVHGNEMPGLAALKAASAGPGRHRLQERARRRRADFRTADAKLVAALHAWFDAQLSDHGPDAMAGHAHHGQGMTSKP